VATEDIVTIAEARGAIRLGFDDVSLEPELTRIITSASRLIDHHFGCMVVRTVTAELHDDPCRPLLQLRQGPVSSITTVTVDGTALTAGQTQIVAGGYGETICRVNSYTPAPWYSRRLQGISVTYVAGRYATTSVVPAVVKDACILQVRHMWRPTQHGLAENVAGEYDTAATAGVPSGLARGVKQLLAEFWRHGAA